MFGGFYGLPKKEIKGFEKQLHMFYSYMHGDGKG